MSNKKLKLSEIKIQSFITSYDDQNDQLKGQGTQTNSINCSTTAASPSSECCTSFFTDCPNDTSQTCVAVYCATDASWSTCNGSCPTDFGMDTCASPGQTGC